MECVYFDPETIRDFLRGHGRGPMSKDYELAVAVLLHRFCEDQTKKPCVIGLKLQDKFVKDLPDLGHLTLDQMKDILRKLVDEDSPLDIAIAEGTTKEVGGNRKGYAFQLKRFGRNPKANDNAALIDYLNGMVKKYAPVEASLFVILESPVEIDLQLVQKSLKTENYPFNRIMYLMKPNDINTYYVGELWPNSGRNEYSPQDIFG